MLLHPAEEGLPAVEAAGVAHWRDGSHGAQTGRAFLITRYLDYSLPYHNLLSRRGRPGLLDSCSRAGRC